MKRDMTLERALNVFVSPRGNRILDRRSPVQIFCKTYLCNVVPYA